MMTPTEQLAYDRGKLEGQRMAHLIEKVGQDIGNLRECAGKLPAGKHRDWLNDLATRLEGLPSE